MATLKTNLIEPEGSTTTLTVGESGGNLIIADSLKANKLMVKTIITAFESSGAATWTCPEGVTSVEVLTLAGGGGGGGGHSGGGGGAGGIVHDVDYTVVPAVVYDLTVGAGGAGGTGSSAMAGTTGTDSTWNDNAEGSGVKHTAKGGGGGGADTALAGGSGGGGCANNDGPGAASNQQSSGTATSGTITSYGNAGGKANDDEGGGGGGAALEGGAASTGLGSSQHGGIGGDGQRFSSFVNYGTNSSNIVSAANDGGYFGGGGGGSSYQGSYFPQEQPGGIGGGGAGAGFANGGGSTGNADDGIANTGGGGGGGATAGGPGNFYTGGTGGNGIVLLKYEQPLGSTTLFQSDGSGNISNQNSGLGGIKVLLSTQTASSSASISFTSGIDSTYAHYIFEFIDINTASDGVQFTFQVNASGQSGYNETMTTTYFRAYHTESGTSSGLGYEAANDQAQGTGYQYLTVQQGNNADQCSVGELHLFNPSSTTYVKNFYSRFSNNGADDTARDAFVGGYINTTAAIDEIEFKAASGNFDGKIKMYGIK